MKNIQIFLKFINFYRKFIYKYFKILIFLINLTKKKKKNSFFYKLLIIQNKSLSRY